jgi:hypothetical protein
LLGTSTNLVVLRMIPILSASSRRVTTSTLRDTVALVYGQRANDGSGDHSFILLHKP